MPDAALWVLALLLGAFVERFEKVGWSPLLVIELLMGPFVGVRLL